MQEIIKYFLKIKIFREKRSINRVLTSSFFFYNFILRGLYGRSLFKTLVYIGKLNLEVKIIVNFLYLKLVYS